MGEPKPGVRKATPTAPRTQFEAFSIALGRELDRGASMTQAKKAAAFAQAEYAAGRWEGWATRYNGARVAELVNAGLVPDDAKEPAPPPTPLEGEEWGRWWREGVDAADALLRALATLQTQAAAAWWEHHTANPTKHGPTAADMLRQVAALVELRRSELRAIVDRGRAVDWNRLRSDYPGRVGQRHRIRGLMMPARYHVIEGWRRLVWSARDQGTQAMALADTLDAMPYDPSEAKS